MCKCQCVKIQVSMPEELIEAVRNYVGRRCFSQYVTEAVAERLRLELMGELSAQLQAEFGPFEKILSSRPCGCGPTTKVISQPAAATAGAGLVRVLRHVIWFAL
jgi:hypothetical protein